MFRTSRTLAILLTLPFAASALAAAAAPTHLDRALSSQRRLVAKQPHNAEALNDLGNLLMLAGETEEAEAAYEQAIGLAPERTAARYNLALLLLETDRRKEARGQLETLLEIDGDHAWAHYQMGLVLAEAGRRRRATTHYVEAFRLDRSLAFPEVNPLILYNDLAQQSILEAYIQSSPAEAAPRAYENAARITGLLVPEAKLSGDGATAREERRQKRRERKDERRQRQEEDGAGGS